MGVMRDSLSFSGESTMTVIKGSHIRNVEAHGAGAVYIEGALTEFGGAQIRDTTFHGCKLSSSASNGGCIRMQFSNLTLERVTMRNLVVPPARRGSALANDFRQSALTVLDSMFESSTGGSLFALRDGIDASFSGCSFHDASASRGAAILAEEATARIQGCTFERNSAHQHGGALFAESGSQVVVLGSHFVVRDPNFRTRRIPHPTPSHATPLLLPPPVPEQYRRRARRSRLFYRFDHDGHL